MKVLALDLSSKTGWALFDEGKLTERGLIQLDRPIVDYYPEYPWNYWRAAGWQAQNVNDLVKRIDPEVVVIEETNRGKNRYTQKFLEFLHCRVLEQPYVSSRKVVYISTGVWRKKLNMQLSKEDKKNNTTLAKAKRKALAIGAKVDRTGLGIRGRIGKKHLAVRYVNATFGLELKMKDNDIADAICLGAAYLAGADLCDGRRDW